MAEADTIPPHLQACQFPLGPLDSVITYMSVHSVDSHPRLQMAHGQSLLDGSMNDHDHSRCCYQFVFKFPCITHADLLQTGQAPAIRALALHIMPSQLPFSNKRYLELKATTT